MALIPLEELADQMTVENNYFLVGRDGTTSEEGHIRLKLHLVWSKKKFFEGQVEKCDEHIAQIDKEVIDLTRFLEEINTPFGMMFLDELEDIIDNDIHTREYDASNILRKANHLKQPTNERKTVGKSIQNLLRKTFCM